MNPVEGVIQMIANSNTHLALAGAVAVVLLGLGGLVAVGKLLAESRPPIAPVIPEAAPIAANDHYNPPQAAIGKPAPRFALEAVQGADFRTIKLDDFKGKWLIVFFYPLDFTFVCPTEICAFSDRVSDFRKSGAEIIGVSIDSKFTHLAWTQRPRREGGIEGLQFPLLSDMNKQMSRDYGVLSDDGVALRGLFIIDPDGIVQHATVNNLPVGRNVDETLRVLHAFQHVREHGDVCPANWEPGHPTMIPDVQASKVFFSHAK
jgi:peroxiredoxin (alkyl hydroperoxide reductase subunit C)